MGPLQGVPLGTNPIRGADYMSEQIPAKTGWQTHRTLDEVRAAALHEAVAIVSAPEYLPTPPLDDRMGLSHVLEIAERFEAWLAGPEDS
jgi:hypothetical protein